ncbi:MAG: aryl-sulfate sulfotransferase N-terminal domain-containing protein [Kluyvera sp.]
MPTPNKIQVIINPFSQNLLSAQVMVTAALPMKFSYSVQGKTPDCSFIYSNDEYILNPTIPIIGLYANMENEIIIECFFLITHMKH